VENSPLGASLLHTSPQQVRIKSSSGVKVTAYEDVESGRRDVAVCVKGLVVGTGSRSSDLEFRS
jgi:hypothetical protein